MAASAVPALPAVSRLAPHVAANGGKILPGSYGLSGGGDIAGELIRHATESWAGDAFIYVGNGQIVEAVPPAVRLARAASRPDAVWHAGYPLTDAQRMRSAPGRAPGRAARTTTRRTSGSRSRYSTSATGPNWIPSSGQITGGCPWCWWRIATPMRASACRRTRELRGTGLNRDRVGPAVWVLSLMSYW